ncbi:MAG: hypothetical protein V1875_07330 [Candidatus Altiarchaeota archaeon]
MIGRMGAEDVVGGKEAGGAQSKTSLIGVFMLLALLFALTYVNILSQDNPMVMALTSFVFFILFGTSLFRGIRIHFPKMLMDTVLVIVLTLVFIQVSYPFFTPRVDVISAEMVSGYSDDTGSYVYEIITATVRKPMVMVFGGLFREYCTDISFYKNAEPIVNTPDAALVKDGNVSRICSGGGFDMVTRVIQFGASIESPSEFSISDVSPQLIPQQNVSEEAFLYAVPASNRMGYPFTMKEKLIHVRVTSDSYVPVRDKKTGESANMPLYDEIVYNYVRNNCSAYDLKSLISSSFRLSDQQIGVEGNFRGYIEAVHIDNDLKVITLDTRVYGTIEPGKTENLYLIYRPVWCFKPPLKDVRIVLTSMDDASVIIPSG